MHNKALWTKCIIKHCEQASSLNMEAGMFHSLAYPFVPVKWHHKLMKDYLVPKIIEYGVSWLRKLSEIPTEH